MSGWLFPHPPVALYKDSQSNFTPGHTCQLICQFHFSWDIPPEPATSPAQSDPLCSLGLATTDAAVTRASPLPRPVHEALCPGSHVFIFLDLLLLFCWAYPLICSWERVQIFDIWSDIPFKKVFIIPFPWLIVWLCIKFKHWSNFLQNSKSIILLASSVAEEKSIASSIPNSLIYVDLVLLLFCFLSFPLWKSLGFTLFLFLFFKLKYSWFTTLCQFLLYTKVSVIQYIHYFIFFSIMVYHRILSDSTAYDSVILGFFPIPVTLKFHDDILLV